MDIRLIFNLTFGVFSFRRGDMRGFNLKRIMVSLVVLPFFIVMFIINHFFLFLDYLIFPFFLKQKIKKPIFIVSAPRNGTTYLYHGLARDEKQFTCIKLWEIIFAPSISQKYFLILIKKIDSLFHSPIYRIAQCGEKVIFGKLDADHPMSFFLPDEDEIMLIWFLASPYLQFYYAGSQYFHDYDFFDERLSDKKKSRLMNRYLNLLKRHNFVFNRKGDKQFLAKNPFMMSKLEALKATFSDAQIVNINRCPLKSIPSTLSLSMKLYGMFTSSSLSNTLRVETLHVLVRWHQVCKQTLDKLYIGQHIKIDFKKLISADNEELKRISRFLELEVDSLFEINDKVTMKHKSKASYQPLPEKEAKLIMEHLPFLKELCQERLSYQSIN